jgi:hypothetical protein
MTFLTEDERNALQKSRELSRNVRAKRAGDLVNPASGIANDYLNRFNEIVMLIEQLPIMPEFIDDIMAWRPTTYLDYFRNSNLPGSLTALEAYEKLDPGFRRRFEALVQELDHRATGSVAMVRIKFKNRAHDNGAALSDACERAGASIRRGHAAIVGHDGLRRRLRIRMG